MMWPQQPHAWYFYFPGRWQKGALKCSPQEMPTMPISPSGMKHILNHYLKGFSSPQYHPFTSIATNGPTRMDTKSPLELN